jgi:gliding motility-associated-like protein
MNTSFLKKSIVAALAIFTVTKSNAQLTVNSTPTPTMLVQNVLLGSGVTATGITFSGTATQRGSFNGTASNIGFASGVLLTTGDVSVAPGPNNSSSAGAGGTGAVCTDPQLNSIATTTLYDGAILEFDFVPMADTLKFRYVFASEEYPEFVCSNFNDVFGFFISGPNPAGGSYSNVNIAQIPGTSLPVAINTVNPGVAGASSGGGSCTSLAYSSLYVNNTLNTVQYDGFTVPLTAKAPVVCGQSYHIKIAIADAGDGAWDSGVFLEEGSFSAVGVQIIPEISYGGANDSTLYEGCGQACIYFVRTSNLSQTDTVNVIIGGSAVNGVDYNTGVAGTPIPSQLIFAIGQDTIVYCIDAVADGITEGLDTITLQISQTGASVCVQSVASATIYLNEYQPLTLTVSDTTLCNSGGTVTLNTTVTGGVEPYTYVWTGGASPVADPVVNVTTTTNFVVTVNDACTGTPDPTPSITDTATVVVATFAPLTVNIGEDILVCPGDLAYLTGLISGGGAPYVYNWNTVFGTDTVVSPHNSATQLWVNNNGIYQLTVTDVCGNTQSDQINVAVETSCALNIPNIITPDGTGPSVNDLFYIANLDKFPGSKLAIYNRWGTKIYESDDYKNNWNGSKYHDGTYYYVLTVPPVGQVSAKVNAVTSTSTAFKETVDDRTKVFAGFFQIARLK